MLLVEDNGAEARLYREYLMEAAEGRVDFACEDRLAAAVRRLGTQAFDVVLLDLNLPDSHGIETFTRLHASVPRIPVVILSGLDDRSLASKAVRQGAQDYLVKSEVSPSLLLRAIRYAIARHQADEALAERERLLELVFETEPECVKVLRPDGTILTMNPAGLRMIEAQALDQVVGRTAADLVVPEQRAAFDQLIHRVFRGESGTLEFEAVGFLGTRRRLETHAVPLRDPDGAVFGLLSITRDVTERRRLQAELLQAQKMEVVGQLAGGIAHDFNNLLTVIEGRAQLLLQRLPSNGPDRRDATLIHETTGRATRLVKQLLAFSRKELARPEVLDVDQTLGSLAVMLSRLIREDIELRIERRAGGACCRIDRGHLEQSVVNLVVNARDAMPDGGTLTITTSTEDTEPPAPGLASTRRVVIEVRDTGVGMTKETRARLFEPFFTTKGARGTGIGLATVRAIVRNAEGEIAVDSEPGRGSTFRISLPLTELGPTPRPVVSPDVPLPGGTETILLVEDDPDLRELAHEILSDRGYHVLVALTGAEAIRVASEHVGDIHLLLTDVVMPQMSGPDVVARVTAVRRGVRVLYMSGYADVMLHAQLDADPSALLLEKPFDARSLTAKVRQILDGDPTPDAQSIS